MILLVFAMLTQAAPEPADRPYTGQMASSRPPAEVAACLAKQLDKGGSVKRTDDGGKIGLFFTFKPLPFMPGNGGHMMLIVAPEGAGSLLTATYGHPISAKTVDRQFRIYAKKCGGVVTPTT